MKIIKKIFMCIAILLVVISFIWALKMQYEYNFKSESTEDYEVYSKIKSKTGVDFSNCQVLSVKDNRGFFGDGETNIQLDCTDTDVIENIQTWNELPLTENINLIMYGGEKDGTSYDYNLAKWNNIPAIKNGRYYFLDKYTRQYKDIEDIHSDEKLFSRASYNFVLAMYDTDTDHLYYFEYDT